MNTAFPVAERHNVQNCHTSAWISERLDAVPNPFFQAHESKRIRGDASSTSVNQPALKPVQWAFLHTGAQAARPGLKSPIGGGLDHSSWK